MKKYYITGLKYLNLSLAVLTVVILMDAVLQFTKLQGNNGARISAEDIKIISRPPEKTVNDYRMIREKSLFNIQIAKKSVETQPSRPQPVRKTIPPLSLNLLLKGTIVSSDKKGSFAILVSKKTQKEYLGRIAEVIEEAEILDIGRNFVVLLFNGEKTTLYAEGSDNSAENSEPEEKPVVRSVVIPESKLSSPEVSRVKEVVKRSEYLYEIPKAEIIKQSKNLGKILQSVQIRPYYYYGKISGFRIERIKKGSFLDTMGILDGDVVTKVNGNLIDSFQKAVKIGMQIKDEEYIKVNVLREGKDTLIVYKIK